MLPAITSLKALRGLASKDEARKPLVGFGDPVFDPAERAKETGRANKACQRRDPTGGGRPPDGDARL